jgi:type IV secretory pathway VirJ component
MSTGPYPIYGPDDENAQNFPMPGDTYYPEDHDYTCVVCAGDGGWWEDDNGNWSSSSDYKGDQVWVQCISCGGKG